MKDLYPVLAAEGLKLKRTLALRLAIWCPTVIVLLVFGIYAGRSEKLGDANLLTGFAQFTLTIWTIILFPLYAALVAALVAAVEHQNESWKHLLALPVNRATIFVAKWLAGIGLLLLSSLVLATGLVATAEALRLMKPASSSSPLPSVIIFKGSCAALFLFSIQTLKLFFLARRLGWSSRPCSAFIWAFKYNRSQALVWGLLSLGTAIPVALIAMMA